MDPTFLSNLFYLCRNIGTLDFNLSAESEPLMSIADCVNVSSGLFYLVEEDFTGNTIEPLRIIRSHDSGNHYESFLGTSVGTQFPLIATARQKGARHSYAMLCERDGALLPYRAESHEYQHKIDPRVFIKGYTNYSREGISGQSNLNNWVSHYYSDENFWVVQTGDGTNRIYQTLFKLSHHARQEVYVPTEEIYLLTEEQMPNGMKRHFHYNLKGTKPRLSKVETLNRVGKKINEINFDYSHDLCMMRSSCGKTITYIQPSQDCYVTANKLNVPKKILHQVISSQNGTTKFHLTAYSKEIPKISLVEKPQGRLLKIDYNKALQVIHLSRPIGPRGELVPIYNFQYEKDFTRVFNASNLIKDFRFDEKRRLKEITTWNAGAIVRQDVFEWDNQGHEGWLKSKSIQLGSQIYYLQNYSYDSRGNITRKKLCGNLTGDKPEFFLIDQSQNMDQYSVDYTYRKDRFNLIESKSTPQGHRIRYEYHPGTNLCNKEIHYHFDKIVKRILRHYDENAQMVAYVEDDQEYDNSSSFEDLTYRLVRQIKTDLRELPSFGKPIEIYEYYLDKTKKEMVLQKRIELDYDAYGHEVGQKVFDSNNQLKYVTTKCYDSFGHVIQETNPLGHIKLYAYDENHNKTRETFPSGRYIEYVYDQGNRLIKETEYHPDGSIFAYQYAYNNNDKLISEIDPYGNQTVYVYDTLDRQIHIHTPAQLDHQGQVLTPVVRKKYNILDQVVEETDENGFTTYYAYNVYGSPTRITHPDGSVERFTYEACGWLKQHWRADGTSIHYIHNPEGKILKETTLDANGGMLKEEVFAYQGNFLIYARDCMGLETRYEYDGAGRKIAERVGEKLKRYEYDSLGRVGKIYHFLNPEQYQEEIFHYDALDRITAKTLMDADGKVYKQESFEYDLEGNCIVQNDWHAYDQIATYRWQYNTYNHPLTMQDPLGSRKNWTHFHHLTNPIAQHVHCRHIIDALNRRCVEWEDVYKRLVKKEIYENDQLKSATEYSYDAKGHLTKRLSRIMAEDRHHRNYDVLTQYNSRGLVSAEIENGTKTTRYFYDSMKRLVTKNKPDGITLHYAYDALGYLSAMSSSDNTIFYTYLNDRQGNPTVIHDHVHQLVQKRDYDLHSRLIQEELSPGMTLKYSYDALDRPIRIILPDQSSIQYIYDACHLKTIQRLDNAQNVMYSVECLDYDLKGLLLKSRSPAGEILYAYDLLSRLKSIKASQWENHLEYDAIGNLIKNQHMDTQGQIETDYQYDALDQLIQEDGNTKSYDSLGNILKNNHHTFEINSLNQLVHDGESTYSYDANGNLLSQTNPSTSYGYDALNRLIHCNQEGKEFSFVYDAFDRCLSIQEGTSIKRLIYQKGMEIGSCAKDSIDELRLVDPQGSERVFAIELQKQVYYPIQDHRYNVCALLDQKGKVRQNVRYSAFGVKSNDEVLLNPWGYANRRQVAGLVQFLHRFYHPKLMRWLTPDPIGFEDGMNLYRFVRNNPLKFYDPDGTLIIVPVLIAFGFGEITISVVTVKMVLATAATLAASVAVHKAQKWIDERHSSRMSTVAEEEELKKKKEHKNKEPVRTRPKNLEEQLALEEAKAGAGKSLNGKIDINDPRYPSDKWEKMQHVHESLDGNKINIHYWKEKATNESHGFKYKDKGN
ncbi:MAG: hypothetical protein BGO14_01240 [Chlamydiales bacterium 38-26]|nr:hypothetical protein [Chlamydiales bacterium]OJV10072.1 MAG: hypothetical protein BGO14_01240 [Chlamydiales bacterium 38-26]